MEESDKKIKKHWLTLLLICVGYGMISILVQLFGGSPLDAFPEVKPLAFAFSFLSQLLFNSILFLCAYRKPGTKLLSFCMIMTAISVLGMPFLYLFHVIELSQSYFALTVSEILGVLWVITSWRMRKLNHKLKTKVIS